MSMNIFSAGCAMNILQCWHSYKLTVFRQIKNEKKNQQKEQARWLKKYFKNINRCFMD